LGISIAKNNVEGGTASTHIEKASGCGKIDYIQKFLGRRDRQRIHRFPEIMHKVGIFTIKETGLIVRIPGLRTIVMQCLP
jgi:hypothetical protein